MKFNKLMAIFAIIILSIQTTYASSQLAGIRVWTGPEKTRIVMDLSQKTDYKTFVLENPFRLVVDLKNLQSQTVLKNIVYDKTFIQNIRGAVREEKDYRVVLDLSKLTKYETFTLEPHAQFNHRLVIDMFHTKAPEPPIVAQPAQSNLRNILIAIDAGHGGEDPGAIGHRGVKEKDVVLAIAKELSKLITNESGIEPLLVRKGDYYVGLRKRSEIARNKRADLFISIHADSFTKESAHGASVFALSRRGATSEAARRLASRENDSDLLGGVGTVDLSNKDKVLASVLLDLSQTASIGASLNFGELVLGEFGDFARLHKRSVEQANFMVLRSPDMPSLLIETGFISNRKEEKNLSNSSYQKKLAKAIMTSVRQYFKSNPPLGTHWYAKYVEQAEIQLTAN